MKPTAAEVMAMDEAAFGAYIKAIGIWQPPPRRIAEARLGREPRSGDPSCRGRSYRVDTGCHSDGTTA